MSRLHRKTHPLTPGLKACRCGGHALAIYVVVMSRVQCQNCFAGTQYCDRKRDAQRLWNQRVLAFDGVRLAT